MSRLLFAVVSSVALSSAAIGAESPGAAPSEPDSSGGLQEVTITAQRREESAQRSALSIQAIGGEELSRAGISRPEDLSKVAPSLSVATGGNMPQVYIRGVGNYATSNYAEGAIAFNIDGVYVSRGWATRGAFFDLERVEVLKGPQGTLYGRNASGGAINLISARPVLGTTSGYVEASAGDYDFYSGSGAVNLPLSDTVALRAAGKIVRRDGYLRTGYEDEKSDAARLNLLFAPTGDFSLLLTSSYQHTDGKGAGDTPIGGFSDDPWIGAGDPRVVAITRANVAPPGFLLMVPQQDGFVDNRIYGLSAEMNWNFGPATLTVLPAYRDGEQSNRIYVASFQLTEAEFDHQSSLEVRLSNQTDKLKWVLGGFFFDEDQGKQDGHDLRLSNALINGERVEDFSSNTRSYAAFGQATFSVTDQLRLTSGLRYTNERKNQSGLDHAYNAPNPTCPPLYTLNPAASPIPFAPCVLDIPLSGRVSFDSITYKAGVEYDLAARSLLYGSVSTGFKSGGFYAAPPPNSFKPEKLTAFEIGVKNRFLDNRLQLNFETFYYRYVDHQESYLGPTSIPTYFTFITSNAGKAKSYGLAADVAFEPTRNDHFGVNVQYNESKYDSFTFGYPTPFFGPPHTGCAVLGPPTSFQTVDCAGFQLVRTPTWSGNVSYDHSFPLSNGARVTAGAQMQFSSSYYLAIDFLPNEREDGFTSFDANLAYEAADNKWSVELWGRNLSNEAIYSQAFRSPFVNTSPLAPDGLVQGSIRPPRTYGLRGRINF